ncbi:hypothetical protein [Escherichia sp. E4385]|uniref:hypothetical protein n=1 Tax=Escherichia sp. E4385 TaxID=2040639 RepID=UPI00197AE8AD|nr:hypothetical protein [Escherichia sp. E4385]
MGIGPLITANSAENEELGTGKWQTGLAAVAVDWSPKWLKVGLVQWQKSFAGDNDRESVASTTFQPFIIYKMSKGWFLRSSGIWTLNVKNDDYYIPAGLGVRRLTPHSLLFANRYIFAFTRAMASS